MAMAARRCVRCAVAGANTTPSADSTVLPVKADQMLPLLASLLLLLLSSLVGSGQTWKAVPEMATVMPAMVPKRTTTCTLMDTHCFTEKRRRASAMSKLRNRPVVACETRSFACCRCCHMLQRHPGGACFGRAHVRPFGSAAGNNLPENAANTKTAAAKTTASLPIKSATSSAADATPQIQLAAAVELCRSVSEMTMAALPAGNGGIERCGGAGGYNEGSNIGRTA
mmetsp:Transcript_109109/g.211328  ORF Transcript_109109/g.211328 Transcript_109109/m.211328 type:complete len:226 (-) Transcript_109109:8-685(-)